MPKIIQPRTEPKLADFALSPQQLAVVEAVQRIDCPNLIVEAVAGAGKTSLLIEVCKVIRGGVVFCAYNKKISDEIGFKLIKANVAKSVKSATLHSLGFQGWRQVHPTVRVDGDKIEKLMETRKVPKHLRGFVKQLVSLAKNSAIGVEEVCHINDWTAWSNVVEHYDLSEKLYNDFNQDVEELVGLGIETAMAILEASVAMDDKTIDFDDMLFSVLYHDAPMFKNDWVLLDEAQDTNTTRRLLAKKMLKPEKGRLIAVGDPHQAIYGFTGADADALDLIAEEFGSKRMPLTITFRCPKAVVKHAQRWVSHIKAADEAPEGIVRQITNAEFMKLVPESTDAILCRNTKPLIQMALGYIRKRIPAHVEGRDIGQSLLTLVNKWRSVKTVGDLRERLETFRENEIQRLQEKGQDKKIQALDDRIGSLNAIMDTMYADDPVAEVAKVIQGLFKDTEGEPVQSITLSTVHKSKGREWDRVYLYGRDQFMPSPWAKQVWEIGQEHNLIYVAVTRAKRELVEVMIAGGDQ